MKKNIKKSVIAVVFVLSGLIVTACNNPFWPDRNNPTEEQIDERNFDTDGGSGAGGGGGGSGRPSSSPGANPGTVIRGNFYTVKFDAAGGTPAPGNQSIAEGAKVTRPSPMSNGALGFGGWYKDAGCTNQWDFATDMVSSEITLFAKWAASGHTVTFDADGGRPAPSDQEILTGSLSIEPPAMGKSGFGFAGWYTDLSYTTQWDFTADTVTGNITLHAKWDTQYNTVTFEANGGLPEPRNQDLAYGATAVEPQAMNRDGHGFGGWYSDPGFSNPWDFDSDTVTANITLYAKWVINTCTVRYFPNDGRAPAMLVVSYGSRLPEMSIFNSTSSFLGWFLAPDNTYKWDFDNDLITKDMELHALWGSVDYVVTFMSEHTGGSIIQEQGVEAGGKAKEHPPINRTGYGFAGWYTDAGTLWDFNVPVTMTMILYPKWVPVIPGYTWVPKGSFMMGDDKTSGALPAHRVIITEGFYMAKQEVTQAEYADYFPTHVSNFHTSTQQPVDKVSWYEAILYCNLLSIADGLSPVYEINFFTDPAAWGPTPTANSATWNDVAMNPTANGYRLPTEAEWEYAARGGNGSPGNYIYSGSSDVNAVAWYTSNANTGTRPVGSLAPNGLGIYDMSGNASEWCWDWYDPNYYFSSLLEDPTGPTTIPAGMPTRVRRGGAWNNSAANVRVFIRNNNVPYYAEWVNGFRVVRGPDFPPDWY